jgi:hypothetical protein
VYDTKCPIPLIISSMDITQRWSFPLVPDMPFGSNPGDNVYTMGFNFIYKAANVKAAR